MEIISLKSNAKKMLTKQKEFVVIKTKNIGELSWMSHNVSFCSFFCKIGALERNAY